MTLRSRSSQVVTEIAAANLMLLILGALSSVLAARLLGPAGRGALTAIFLWANFLGSISLLGLQDAVVYFAADPASRPVGSTNTSGGGLGVAGIIALGSGLLFGVLGFMLMPELLHSQAPSTVRAARIYLVFVVAFVLTLPSHALRGIGRFRLWNTLRVLPTAAWVGILVVASLFGWRHPQPLAYLNLAAGLTLGVITFVISLRVFPEFRTIQRKLALPLLRYGLPSVLVMVPQTLNVRLDQLLLVGSVAPRDLGIYVTAVAWSSIVTPVLAAGGSFLFPHLASLPAADRPLALSRATRSAAAVSVVAALIVGVLAPAAIPLIFGSAYRDAVAPALLLVMAAGASGLCLVLQDGLRGFGLPSVIIRGECAGLVVTLIILLGFLSKYGIMAAAVASLLGYVTTLLITAQSVKRRLRVSSAELLLPRRSDLREMAALLRR